MDSKKKLFEGFQEPQVLVQDKFLENLGTIARNASTTEAVAVSNPKKAGKTRRIVGNIGLGLAAASVVAFGVIQSLPQQDNSSSGTLGGVANGYASKVKNTPQSSSMGSKLNSSAGENSYGSSGTEPEVPVEGSTAASAGECYGLADELSFSSSTSESGAEPQSTAVPPAIVRWLCGGN